MRTWDRPLSYRYRCPAFHSGGERECISNAGNYSEQLPLFPPHLPPCLPLSRLSSSFSLSLSLSFSLALSFVYRYINTDADYLCLVPALGLARILSRELQVSHTAFNLQAPSSMPHSISPPATSEAAAPPSTISSCMCPYALTVADTAQPD
jgi:hypothetical protein